MRIVILSTHFYFLSSAFGSNGDLVTKAWEEMPRKGITAIISKDKNCLFVFRAGNGESGFSPGDEETTSRMNQAESPCITKFPRVNRSLYKTYKIMPAVTIKGDMVKIDCKNGNEYYAKRYTDIDLLQIAKPQIARIALEVPDVYESVYIRKDAVLWICRKLENSRFKSRILDSGTIPIEEHSIDDRLFDRVNLDELIWKAEQEISGIEHDPNENADPSEKAFLQYYDSEGALPRNIDPEEFKQLMEDGHL